MSIPIEDRTVVLTDEAWAAAAAIAMLGVSKFEESVSHLVLEGAKSVLAQARLYNEIRGPGA